jgi:hypothetical protein
MNKLVIKKTILFGLGYVTIKGLVLLIMGGGIISTWILEQLVPNCDTHHRNNYLL